MEKHVAIRLTKIESSTEKLKPEDFLIASNKISANSLLVLKELYDLTKSAENDASSSSALQRYLPTLRAKKSPKKKGTKKNEFSRTEVPLSTLITDNFDQDQIWEEIQLQNGLIYETLVSSISKVLAHKFRAQKAQKDDDDDDDETILRDLEEGSAENGNLEEDEDDLSDFFESDSKSRKKKSKQQTKYSKSIVDDKFFNLAQMTEFVDKMDTEEGQSEDDDDNDKVDYFKGDEENEEEEEDLYYKDFFDPPLDEEERVTQESRNEDRTNRPVQFNLEEDENATDDEENGMKEESNTTDDDDEGPNSVKEEDVVASLSTFEKKRRRIEENIEAMEEQALQPKSWQLTGEVTAQTRPENSLLEEHLLYDHLLRQAPEITTKTTQKLEDIIKQRVKDQSWDDVIRKIKPIENISEYKKRLVLDAEKSKISLTEIYEKEYIEKQNDGGIATTEEDKDPEEHKTIKKDLQTLFAKLDALSHFNYTPKAPVPEIKTITNATATSMEEITPSTFSEAMLLAPQEILEPAKGEIKGKSERTSTDKKRERRLKKKKQHLKRLSQEEKARAKGLGLRNIRLAESVVKKSKRATNDDSNLLNSKELKSSKAFFAKLQEQVSSHISKVAKKNKASMDAKVISVKKYKL